MGDRMKRIHGGDIYNHKVNMDFSVNINPLGIPERVKAAMHAAIEHCDCYPDIACAGLKQAVAAERADNVLFGNGASELFLAIVHAIEPKQAVIPIPSFYGYEYAVDAVGCRKAYCSLQEGREVGKELIQALTGDIDLLFLANPNNPTGQILERETIVEVLNHCRDRGIYVVMDECFIDFCEGVWSAIDLTDHYENLIVVRAFTKLYAIPGVRLGYLVCGSRTEVKRIESHLPEWNVSVIAQAAGIACMGEEAYVARTRAYVSEQRRKLTAGLTAYGFRVYDSRANFLLFYTELPLFKLLLDKGILIRDCSNYRGLTSGFYRVAVKTEEENEKLLKAIGVCIEEYRAFTANGNRKTEL